MADDRFGGDSLEYGDSGLKSPWRQDLRNGRFKVRRDFSDRRFRLRRGHRCLVYVIHAYYDTTKNCWTSSIHM
jgi:hypothetical protein